MQKYMSPGGTGEKDPYLTQKIMSANNVQLVSYMYDTIMVACKKEDADRAQKGLMGLIDSLNFDHEEIALPMFQLYQYCLERIRTENYKEVDKLIGGLKLAWSEAMNVN